MSLLGKVSQIQEDTPELDDNLNIKLKWFVFGAIFTNALRLIINIIIK